MPLTKKGEQISWKEFFKRWKEGISGITPQQKISTQIWGTRLILLGLALGLIISLISIKNLWWLSIILAGGLINTVVQYIGLKQQLKVFKDINKQLE